MIGYIIKRLKSLVFVLLGITILSFILTNIAPIDPAEAYVRRTTKNPSEEQLEILREEMGLNDPIYVQYIDWVKNAVTLEFGESLITGNPVIDDVKSAFLPTIKLVFMAMIIIFLVSIPFGVLTALYKDSILDHVIRIVTLLGISIPSFWFGFVTMYYFAVKLKLLPVVGYGEFENIILPAVTLAVPMIASNIRILRANMLENMEKDYVEYARIRGVSEKVILWKHVLKNAIPPMITLFGQTVGYMVAGTAIVESIFSWPGLGMYALNAIMGRDFPAINAYIIILATIFVFCNLLSDIINIAINPSILKEG